MDGLLRVDSARLALPASPTNSSLADEVASTCPLLTPSPPTNALVNSLPESEEPTFMIGDELVNKLQHVKDETNAPDSASSSSSALAEPACTQLLNHNHYHHITKDEETSMQETAGKLQALQLTFKNPPDNYCFMKWNWPLIRKLSVWFILSILIAMVALVVAMVVSLPKTCNPPTEWYQGKVMYEIFPASFSDSNANGIGDLRGLATRINYLSDLGIIAVRLNSIFPSNQYPDDYKNITTLLEIEKDLGSMEDFSSLVNDFHAQNIYVLLDLPLWPLLPKIGRADDEVSEIITFWVNQGVDGFYLKGLEHYLDDDNFVVHLRRWKKILGQDRIIIVSHDVIDFAPDQFLGGIYNNVDLVDVRLNVEEGAESITHQVQLIQNGTLFSKANMPWIHWSLGDENSVRLADRLPFSNATLGATLLQLMLPGTPSIFYGDEIGLKQIVDVHGNVKDLLHLHHLAVMVWQNKSFTQGSVVPWIHGQSTHTDFDQVKLVSKAIQLRTISPSIYVNALTKDGCNKATAEVKYSKDDLLVIQRWYPRRKLYVVVSNLGATKISADLSRLLYSGEVVVGPKADSKSETISFKAISLWPGESVIILLH